MYGWGEVIQPLYSPQPTSPVRLYGVLLLMLMMPVCLANWLAAKSLQATGSWCWRSWNAVRSEREVQTMCCKTGSMSAQPGPPYVSAGLVERLSRTIGFLPLMIMGARIFGIPSVMPHQARALHNFLLPCSCQTSWFTSNARLASFSTRSRCLRFI